MFPAKRSHRAAGIAVTIKGDDQRSVRIAGLADHANLSHRLRATTTVERRVCCGRSAAAPLRSDLEAKAIEWHSFGGRPGGPARLGRRHPLLGEPGEAR